MWKALGEVVMDVAESALLKAMAGNRQAGAQGTLNSLPSAANTDGGPALRIPDTGVEDAVCMIQGFETGGPGAATLPARVNEVTKEPTPANRRVIPAGMCFTVACPNARLPRAATVMQMLVVHAASPASSA